MANGRGRWRKSPLFLFLVFSFASASLWADEDPLTFLPAGLLFKPLWGDLQEPQFSLAPHFSNGDTDASLGGMMELFRWEAAPDMACGAGFFYDTSLLMRSTSSGSINPRAVDWYAGIFGSEKTGAFTHRFEWQHQVSHPGDYYQVTGIPMYFSWDNLNLVSSFSPSEEVRIYLGLGTPVWWDDLPLQGSKWWEKAGVEICSSPFDFLETSFRVYGTYNVKFWDVDSGGFLTHTLQLGFSWKWRPESSQGVRCALIYHNGEGEYGQLYAERSDYFGLGFYFDP